MLDVQCLLKKRGRRKKLLVEVELNNTKKGEQDKLDLFIAIVDRSIDDGLH
jgi:hypothetical protein